MSLYEVLLFLHILGAFLMVAAAGLSTATGIVAARTTNPRTMTTLLDLQARAEWFGTTPGALVAVIFGSWLVDEGGFDYGDSWVTLAYVFWFVALAIDHGVLIPYNRRVRRRATDLIDKGIDHSDELRSEAASPIAAAVGLALDGSLIIFIYLMVAKPGA